MWKTIIEVPKYWAWASLKINNDNFAWFQEKSQLTQCIKWIRLYPGTGINVYEYILLVREKYTILLVPEKYTCDWN